MRIWKFCTHNCCSNVSAVASSSATCLKSTPPLHHPQAVVVVVLIIRIHTHTKHNNNTSSTILLRIANKQIAWEMNAQRRRRRRRQTLKFYVTPLPPSPIYTYTKLKLNISKIFIIFYRVCKCCALRSTYINKITNNHGEMVLLARRGAGRGVHHIYDDICVSVLLNPRVLFISFNCVYYMGRMSFKILYILILYI